MKTIQAFILACVLVGCGADPPAPSDPSGVIEPTAAPRATLTEKGSMMVRNATAFALCGIYVSTVTAPDWGANQLDGGRLSAGEQITIEVQQTGSYDLRATDCDEQNADVRFGVSIEGDTIWQIEGATLQLTNESGEAICGLYARTSEAMGVGWGGNRLPDPLPAGEDTTITLTQTLWDLRAAACDPTLTPVEVLGMGVERTSIWSPEFEE